MVGGLGRRSQGLIDGGIGVFCAKGLEIVCLRVYWSVMVVSVH